MADVGAAAVERLESALYLRRTGANHAAANADALASIAASVIRLAGAPTSRADEALLAQLIADVAALHDAVRDARHDVSAFREELRGVFARLDALEERP